MVKNGNKKVLVAMSGGVDSSVAAYLLASEGYDLIGIHMKFYSETEELDSNKHLVKEDNKCCSIESSEDVRNICNRLGIPFYVLNFREEFKENIVEYFVSSLKKGITPNPCIMCNRDIKFGLLFDKMKELNASYIATGHYARVVNENGKYLLKRALDSYQDQSYFLCNINREVLPHLIFPLGEIENKDRVREIAYNNGLLRVSSKKDSQDICFVANNDTKEFIKKNVLKNVTDEGNILDTHGNVIGVHSGLSLYTIGQRRGFNTNIPKPLYVISKDFSKNTLTVGELNECRVYKFRLENMNYIVDNINKDIDLKLQIRYKGSMLDIKEIEFNDNTVNITLLNGEIGVAPGQFGVLYYRDSVVGGGIINY